MDLYDKETRVKKFKEYKEQAERAIVEQKIFRIISAYDVPRVKYELVKRGYVESISHSWNDEYSRLSDVILLQQAQDGNVYEQALLSRLIGGNSAKYMWITASQLYETYQSVPYLSKINIRDHNFGTKDELHFYVQKINSAGSDCAMGPCLHPRSHSITGYKSLRTFQFDFRATFAIGLVMHLHQMESVTQWMSHEHGSLDLKILDYAMALVIKYIKWIKNEIETDDSDEKFGSNIVDEHRWIELHAVHEAVIQLGQSFKPVGADEVIENFIFRLKYLAQHVLTIWPSRKYDGTGNVWLLKPTNSSQGQGIVVTDNEKCILSHLAQSKKRFVIQKYIETPLLIYGTKFDIRSYFLIVIDANYLRVWCSPVASIKFASSEYTLDDLDERIHITNAYVQMKYRATPKSNPIPNHRMWSYLDLQDYLDTVAKPNCWQQEIYPSMKRTIAAIVDAAFDNIDKRPGRFELFGVDWIVTGDFKVFLLEIQRPPGMGTYSPVSTFVCGQILEDVIRVTVDFANDPTAPTGTFEIIYERALRENAEETNSTTKLAEDSKISNVYETEY